MRGKFPVFATILLIFSIVWILNEIHVFYLDIPWIPVILLVVSIGLIFNRFNK